MFKGFSKILILIILLSTIFCASVPMPGSSTFSFVSSSKLTEGHNLFVKREYEKAIVILNEVISDAINKSSLTEAAHAHGQLGMLYAEMVYYNESEKHHREAIDLAEKSGYDPSIFYAQWGITRARMWDYDNEMKYADKALDLLAGRWKKPSTKDDSENRDAIICPIPGLLYRRLTEGLYYELYRTHGFDNAYGTAFQDYVGKAMHNANPTLTIQPEFGYGGRRAAEKTSDWIVYDKETTLLVECKTKRLTMEAKSILFDDTAMNEQITIMSKAFVQIYKTLFDCQNGLYTLTGHNSSKTILPLVVTLEEWYLYGGRLIKLLDQKIKAKLITLNIPESIIDEHPYTFCSVDSLIYLIQTSSKNGIKTMLLHKWNDMGTREWTLDTFLMNYYPVKEEKEQNSTGESDLEGMLFS